jgi:acetyltransferase-like isoleucine patch superfamily enzyme
MTGQLTLDYTKPITRAELFAEFHRKNPQVLERLEQLIREKIAREGLHRMAIAYFYEVLRDEYFLTHGDAFRLNQNWRSHYVDLIKARNPVWAPYFETRTRRSA